MLHFFVFVPVTYQKQNTTYLPSLYLKISMEVFAKELQPRQVSVDTDFVEVKKY